MPAQDDRLVPVIIGVGQINDRPSKDVEGLATPDLMVAALRQAEMDAGVEILSQVQSLDCVAHISFDTIQDTPRRVVKAIGAEPRFVGQSAKASGDSPVRLLHDAANRIGRGEVEIAAIVGGEAMRTHADHARRRAAAATAATDERLERVRQSVSPLRQKYGLLMPTDLYPLYENTTRAAWGQTLTEAQAESARIWSDFSKVAAGNPGAWVHQPLEPEQILASSENNRPISFPYNKLMVANNAVNQGAAVIITSLAKAKALGIPESRLIYVGPGAAAHEDDDFLAREDYSRSVGMAVSIERTMQLNQLTTGELDHVEFYSCFPCVPKMARRVIDWPIDKPMSVYGGLTFGGGPIGNCMMHAIACMTDKLREHGTNGLIFANGGFATYNHTIILTKRPVPAGTFPQSYNYQQEADALRGPAPNFLEDYCGQGTIESYVVPFDRAGAPTSATIIGRTLRGDRFVAGVPATDSTMIDFLISGEREPVGTRGHAVTVGDRIVWQK